jgi:DNA-binding NarL/FixJ family response regulator
MRFCILNSEAQRRESLKALLRQLNRQAKFNEARDWWQAQCLLKTLPPDLLVIDWQQWMQVKDVEQLLRVHPNLLVAVLVDEELPVATVAFLMHTGVLAVAPRQLGPQLIIRVLEFALLGGQFVPATVVNVKMRTIPVAARSKTVRQPSWPSLGGIATLSPRQQQIMRFVHMGATNKTIARTLGISEGTVKIHLSSVFQQLGASNRAAAVALYNGWQPEP